VVDNNYEKGEILWRKSSVKHLDARKQSKVERSSINVTNVDAGGVLIMVHRGENVQVVVKVFSNGNGNSNPGRDTQ
jgi:hypothetical protein